MLCVGSQETLLHTMGAAHSTASQRNKHLQKPQEHMCVKHSHISITDPIPRLLFQWVGLKSATDKIQRQRQGHSCLRTWPNRDTIDTGIECRLDAAPASIRVPVHRNLHSDTYIPTNMSHTLDMPFVLTVTFSLPVSSYSFRRKDKRRL